MINNTEHRYERNADETQTKIFFANGDSAVIHELPAQDAEDLKNAILSAVPNINLKDFESENYGALISILCGIESNKNYNQCLKKCLIRGITYNNVGIDQDAFANKKAKENYYTIVIELLKINVWPFFKGLPFLSSMLKNIQTLKNQKQKSE